MDSQANVTLLQVELVCNVHAHPAPTVTWEKGGVAVGGAGGRVKAVNNGHRHTLVIQQVQAEDFGQYSCRGANTLGSQTKVIELSGIYLSMCLCLIYLSTYKTGMWRLPPII